MREREKERERGRERERRGESDRDRDREPTHAICPFDRKDNSMKLLASVESTTILIDNQLCVREGGLAFAERDPPAGARLFSPLLTVPPSSVAPLLPDVGSHENILPFATVRIAVIIKADRGRSKNRAGSR